MSSLLALLFVWSLFWTSPSSPPGPSQGSVDSWGAPAETQTAPTETKCRGGVDPWGTCKP